MLEVVQNQQHLLVTQVVLQRLQQGAVVAPGLPEVQRRGDGAYQMVGIAKSRKLHQKHALLETVE